MDDEEAVQINKESREERFKKRHGDSSEHVTLGENKQQQSPKPKQIKPR